MFINLLRRLLADPPQRQVSHAYPSSSLHSSLVLALRRNSQLQESTFCRRERLYGRVVVSLSFRNFVLLLFLLVVLVFSLCNPPTIHAHITILYLDPSMLRKYLKNEFIGRWLPDIHHYTHSSEIELNRFYDRAIGITFLAAKKDFSLASLLFPSSHSPPFVVPTIFPDCRRTRSRPVASTISTDDRNWSDTSASASQAWLT